jgi:hypothetical protein
MKKLILISTILFLSACASVQSVSLTQIPAKRSQEVTAQASKTIILGFNFNNDFVDNMTEDLKRQCPNGEVTGILTKDEAINYFLWMVHKRQVTATGYCNREVASAPQAPASNSKAGVKK